jgi:hypothetical protein
MALVIKALKVKISDFSEEALELTGSKVLFIEVRQKH